MVVVVLTDGALVRRLVRVLVHGPAGHVAANVVQRRHVIRVQIGGRRSTRSCRRFVSWRLVVARAGAGLLVVAASTVIAAKERQPFIHSSHLIYLVDCRRSLPSRVPAGRLRRSQVVSSRRVVAVQYVRRLITPIGHVVFDILTCNSPRIMIKIINYTAGLVGASIQLDVVIIESSKIKQKRILRLSVWLRLGISMDNRIGRGAVLDCLVCVLQDLGFLELHFYSFLLFCIELQGDVSGNVTSLLIRQRLVRIALRPKHPSFRNHADVIYRPSAAALPSSGRFRPLM